MFLLNVDLSYPAGRLFRRFAAPSKARVEGVKVFWPLFSSCYPLYCSMLPRVVGNHGIFMTMLWLPLGLNFISAAFRQPISLHLTFSTETKAAHSDSLVLKLGAGLLVPLLVVARGGGKGVEKLDRTCLLGRDGGAVQKCNQDATRSSLWGLVDKAHHGEVYPV